MAPSRAPLHRLFVLAPLLAGCPGNGGETGTTDAVTTAGTTGSSSDAPITTGDTMTASTTGDETTGTGATTSGATSETTGMTGETTGTTSGTTSETTSGTTSDVVGCESTGGETTGETTGETGDPVCTCILDDPEGGWGEEPSLPTCGEMLCPIVQADAGFDAPEFMVVNPEALVCALTALRDRTPGVVRWEWRSNGGQFIRDGYILIRDDGVAIRRWWGPQDLDYVVWDAHFGTMPGACAFAQCLAATSAQVRFDCLENFPLGPPLGQCDEGWTVYMP